jgi:Transposase
MDQYDAERPASPDWPSIPSSSSPASSPTSASPQPRPPLRRRREYTSRDDRIRARTLREIGWTYSAIARHTGLIFSQARYASNNPPTPRKRSGRPSFLSEKTVKQIIDWICVSAANRRSRWDQIPQKLGLDIRYYCIRYALRKAGFSRYLARRKPPISERNRQARLAFTLEYQE